MSIHFTRAVAIVTTLALFSVPVVAKSAGETLSANVGEFAWGAPRKEFAIGVKPMAVSELSSGSIMAVVAIENLAGRPVSIQRQFDFIDYAYRLIDSGGKAVAQRSNVHVGGNWSIGGDTLVLHPGQVQSEAVDLSALYKLAPGKYTLFVRRTVMTPKGEPITELGSQPTAFSIR